MNKPICDRSETGEFKLGGCLAPYLSGITEQWLKVVPSANPGMLEMYADRDCRPYRDLVPWAGEFSGKYLTGAVQVLRLTRDPDLKRTLEGFVKELMSLQDKDGYLGPWPADSHVTNKVVYPDGRVHWTWDTWGHYHNSLGLMLWYEETGDRKALKCVKRMADLMCARYLAPKGPRMVETGSTEMNMAPAHSLCLLYKKTGERKYLDLARQIVDEEFAAKDATGTWLTGDYLNGPLAGLEFFELPKPRWESLHPIMAMAELFHITGEEKYREAFGRIWRSIANLDRHNNGGFSSGEQAYGNPFLPYPIETCCTIAWTAMTVEMLRLTGDPVVADELELTLLNSIVGMHSFTGRWATYNTPMDGVRRASAHDIVFQSREGTPELNCCSVNSVRGFGMLSDWALMQDESSLILNWYGAGVMKAVLPGKVGVALTQTTDYPRDGKILLGVAPSRAAEFTLKLRIPRWSGKTTVKVNGEAVKGVRAGTYLALTRKWRKGDEIALTLDMTLHFWTGELECAGKVSVYRGPILLTYDRRFNDLDADDVPFIGGKNIKGRVLAWKGRVPPVLLMEFTATDGRRVQLCDHGSAGEGGTSYRSWLPLHSSGAALPEFFASSRQVLDCAELQRFACQYRQLPILRKQMTTGWPKPEHLIVQLTNLEQSWPRFDAACVRVRALLGRDPECALAKALQETLVRIERELGIPDAAFLDRVARMKDEIVKEYKLPHRFTVFEASQLLPPVTVIGDVQRPPAGLAFKPVTTITSESFCDIRSFHDAKNGLLYIRTAFTAREGESRRLVYGADGAVKVWVNGQEVGCHPEATNPAKADAFQVEAKWQPGVNEIVFALATHDGRAWGVFAKLTA